MRITFLQGRVPLTKTFAAGPDDTLIKHPYPHVFHFTSHTHDIPSLPVFLKCLRHHARQHHCLLKGEISHALHNEPRAGSTDPNTPTQWLCLDIDGLPGVTKPHQLVKNLPAEFHNVSYITQYSCSMGVDPDKGLSVHLFFLLDKSYAPAQLKLWLTELNLSTPLLRENLRLSRTHTVIKWPLDITVVQNDKLIYIAPPLLRDGAVDHFKKPRIALRQAPYQCLVPRFDQLEPTKLRARIDKALHQLRRAAGLPRRQNCGEKLVHNTLVACTPGQAMVTNIRTERGFVYLNLNGGDSWGYYHPQGQPEILYNFKGEPNYLIKELLPGYYAEAPRAPAPPAADTEGVRYLTLLDKRSSTYYRGVHILASDRVEIYPARTVKMLNDFLAQHAQPRVEFVPEWDIDFSYDDERSIDTDKRLINLYRPSRYFSKVTPVAYDAPPPTITRILKHALGDDPATVEHFLNWLACIIQHRCKVGTAWILGGCQGTGKGLLFDKVITPLVGEAYCEHTSLRTFNGEFNGFMRQALFILVDEVEMTRMFRDHNTIARLKAFITEERIDIRALYSSPYTTRNFSHFIFATNKSDPIEVAPDDRRFHVATRQETPLTITATEVAQLHNELAAFADYLRTRGADLVAARTPLQNESRRRLQELTRDSSEAVADAIKNGDLQFLFDNRPDTEEQGLLSLRANTTSLPTFRAALEEIVRNLETGRVSRNAAETIFFYITGNAFPTRHKFTKFLAHKGLFTERMRIDNNPVHGIRITRGWRVTPELLKEIKTWLAPEQAQPRLRVIKER